MEPNNIAAMIAAAGAIAAAIVAAWVTRQNAKDSQERTDAVTLTSAYNQLWSNQRTDIRDLRDRVTHLESTVTTLQGVIAAFRLRARAHMRWDDELVAQVNEHVPGAHIRPAPPLLEEDA